MRYFYDTEFIEDGETIELVSFGVVAEDGREFYAVSSDFDPASANAAARRLAGEEVSVQVSEDQGYATVTLSRPVRVLGLVEVAMTKDAQATARVEDLP